jgi:soluble lytic murein transglycosylase-like protein
MMKNFLHLTSPTIKYLLSGFLLFSIFNQVIDNTGFIIPVKKLKQEVEESITKKNLKYLGAPNSKVVELSGAVKMASESTNLNEQLIVALIKTESNFRNNAVSSKNYQGLMQTPTATFIYSDVDILHGARILKDKLKITNGNLLQALTLYKGGNNPVARKYAIETMELYTKLLNRKENI